MKIDILIIPIILFSIFTAFWGPKWLLWFSGIFSILSGISLGLLKEFNTEGLFQGIFLGILFSLFLITSGISVRRHKQKGGKILKDFIHQKHHNR